MANPLILVFLNQRNSDPFSRAIQWIVILLFWGSAFAQTLPVQFEHLTTANGLLGNNVRSIIQDRKGFLWFSTYGGISRYHGYRFKPYQYDAHDTTTLGGSHVIDLWEDPQGFIWAAISNGGLARLDPRTDRVRRYMANRNQPGALPTNDVTAVRGDNYGNLWVGMIEGLCRLDVKTEQFTRYTHSPNDSSSLSTNSMISDLHRGRDGTIWVATVDHGFNRINRHPGQHNKPTTYAFTRYEHQAGDATTIADNQVMDLFEDHTGMLWVGTRNGLNCFDPRRGHRTALYQYNSADETSISSNWVSQRAIGEDQQGNLWIGTQNGLNRLNPARTHFDRFYHDPTNTSSIIDNVIRAVCVDRSGIIWLGSNDAGVSWFDPNRRILSVVGLGPGKAKRMAGHNIRSICQDNQDHFWVGTEGGGLFGFNPSMKPITSIQQTSRTGLPTNFIGPMMKDRNGAIWMGMGSDWSSGTRGQIVRFEPEMGNFTTFLPFPSPHHYAFILTITEDEQGRIWFGTGNMGMIVYDPIQKYWRQYVHNPADSSTLRGKWARAVTSDRRGHIWIGTDAGLDRLEYTTGRITHFVNNPKDPYSLSSSYILSLCTDRAGRLWVGTDGGLCQYDAARKRFIRYTEKDGLPDNTIANLVEDSDGNIWLNTLKGLCRLNPQNKTFIPVDLGDNYFISGNVHIGACYKADEGTLFFGGKNGFIHFHPHDLRFNQTKPPVVLTALHLFDKLLPGSYDRQTLTLDHDQNSLTLDFAALNYTSSEKNQYAYQLEGFDPDWVYAGTRRTVTYTNLDPGTYTFRVKGANNDGLWNEKGTFMTLVIQPAWWQTTWFRILLGMGLAGLIYAVYRYRLAQLRHIQTLRDQIARDLHDDVGGVLTGISFYSEAASAMHREGRYADSYALLQKIADNARTTIERMSDVVWSMRSDTNNALRLAERLESFGHELLAHRNIQLLVETDPVLERFSLPPNVIRNLYLIGKEAIHNAARHSGATEVRLMIRQTGGKVNLTVQDNGQGFVSQTNGEGNGLDSMKKRAEVIGADYQLITALTKGTTVRVRMAA